MAIDVNCPCSPEQVDLAFRESEPFIEQEIRDRSYAMRRFMVDLAPVKIFPDGVGYELSKVRFFGDIGPQYDGFDGWRKEQRSRPAADGCGPAHDACGYVWEEVGHGFEELHYHLMERDLKTVPICLKDIRTFWQFQQFQNLIFKNLTEITANMREQLNRNALIGFSVKHVPTSVGLQINAQNPYELPNIAGVEVGKLNWRTLTRLYNALVREAGTFALTYDQGRPVFGLIASDEVVDDMYVEDRELLRVLYNSGQGQDILTRYNFQNSIRGLFVNIPDIYAPRYRDDGAGNLIRVFPYERDVVIQCGTRPAPNPDYENAPYELVIILTRDVFNLRSRKTISTVGGETDFEAETGMFDWKWHNPERWCDPNRRVGFYYANGNIGIEPGDFTDIPAILVKRRPKALDTLFWPAAVCPPEAVDCENELGAQGCPCPQIVDCCPLYSDPNSLQFRFSRSILPAVVTDPISIRLDTGGVAVGTIDAISVDGLAATVDFGEPVECCPGHYVEVLCEPSDLCVADVISELVNATTATNRDVRLEALLRATAGVGDQINALLEDGTYVLVEIIAIDSDTATYEVEPVVAGSLDNHCIQELCVTPAVDPLCPACSPATVLCDPTEGLE